MKIVISVSTSVVPALPNARVALVRLRMMFSYSKGLPLAMFEADVEVSFILHAVLKDRALTDDSLKIVISVSRSDVPRL